MWTIKGNTDAVTSEMCQLKALAVAKELGITGFKATLRLCQLAGANLASSRDRLGVATANPAQHPHVLHWPLLALDSL